jgi:hypothetical protein
MGPNLESCALTRGNLRVLGGSNFSNFIDKLQIIERYNHKTKRCCMVSEDDATSSSRAIECPKAGNVRKMPDSARIDRGCCCRLLHGARTIPTVAACVGSGMRLLPLRPHRRGGAETLKEPFITWERCRVLDTRSHDDHWTKCRHPQTPYSSRFIL